MSFLLTIQGLMATAFVAALVLGLVLPKHWKLVGCAVVGLATAFAAVRLAEHPSQLLDIFFAALWAAIGAFPGAALGSWIHGRFRRSA